MLQRKRRRRLAGFLTGMLLAVVLMLFTAGGLFAQAAGPIATPDPAPVVARLDGHDLAIAQLKAEVEALKARLHTPPPARVVASAAVAPVVTQPPRPVQTAPASFSGVVPPGMHAHRRVDGSVFVHGPESHGDPHAHAGVAPPWVQIATAGQYVPPSGPTWSGAQSAPAHSFPAAVPFTFSQNTVLSSGCPGGVCPTQAAPAQFRPFGGLFRR